MSNLVVPVCGESSRYPDVRPKWLLSHPHGNLMFVESMRGIIKDSEVDNAILIARTDHLDKYGCRAGIKKQFFRVFGDEVNFDVVELDFKTNSQPETVFEGLKRSNLNENSGFLVKDCDNYFSLPHVGKIDRNIATFYEVGENKKIKAFNKSYLKISSGEVEEISEREVISRKICTGGYGFDDFESFAENWKKLKEQGSPDGEFHMSDVVQTMIEDGFRFDAARSPDFTDWGTLEDWRDYKSDFGTYFVDIDGVLMKNASEIFHPKWGESHPLEENVEAVNELYESGKNKVILVTARLSEYREETERKLEELGIKYHDIIFDLPHAKRYLVNDYSGSNSYPTSIAVNVKRDSDNLKDKL